MTYAKSHLIGSLIESGERTRQVELVADQVSNLTAAEKTAGIEWVNGNYEPGDVRRYGAIGDGTTDDTLALQNAVDGHPDVYFPDGTYKITTAITVPDNRNLYGEGTIAPSSLNTSFSLGSNNVVDGLSFDGANATTPFWGIYAEAKDNVTVKNCTLTDLRIYIRNQAAAVHKDVFIYNNYFDVDFTGEDLGATQLDINSVYGMQNVKIRGNTYAITNVTRCLKISDNPGQVSDPDMSNYSSNRIVITDNTFSGSTTSNKQLYDGFIGAGDLVFSNNVVDVTGFNTIVEDKTHYNAPADGSNPKRSLVMTGNVITSDGTIVALQGSYGITETGYDGDRRGSALITGNFMKMTGTSETIVCDARFLETVIFNGNDIVTDAAANMVGLQPASNEGVILQGNRLTNCCINCTKATTNHEADTFSGEFDSLLVDSNSISDFDAAAGIIITSVNSPYGSVNVTNNHIRTGRTLTQAGRALRFASSETGFTRIVGNTYETDVSGTSTPVFTSHTYRSKDYHSNSWQPTLTWSGSVPTTGTYRRGDVVRDSSPSASAAPGWVCVTTGTFSSATDSTGDTDGSTAVITGMTDTSDFNVNDYVTVSAGFPSASTRYRIIDKTTSSVTLDTNSNSSQTDVTVATADPVFKAMASVAA